MNECGVSAYIRWLRFYLCALSVLVVNIPVFRFQLAQSGRFLLISIFVNRNCEIMLKQLVKCNFENIGYPQMTQMDTDEKYDW